MQKPLLIFQNKIVLFVVLPFFIISIFDLSIAQVIIKEKVEIYPVTIPINNNQLTDTSQTHKINYLENVQRNNISGDNAQSTVTIPFYGRVTVEVILSDAALSSRVSLEIRQPEYQVLSEYANHNVGFAWASDNMAQGTAVEFGIDWYWNNWGTIYQGKEAGVITTQIDSTEYTMGFEALGDDWDYNELVIRVKFIPTEIVVTIDPPIIFPGDTANVIIKNRLADGTLIDLPPTQKFEAAMLDGCIYGQLKAGVDSGAYLDNVFQPIIFIADTNAIDSGAVLLRVGLVEETALNKLDIQTGITFDCFPGYFISKNYNDANVSIDNPLFIIYPTPFTIERISEEPRMPTVVCKATLKKFYPGTIKYEWKYIVRKTYKRWGLCERISKSEFQGLSYSNSSVYTEWTVPFVKDSGIFSFTSLSHRNQDIPGYGCKKEIKYWYDENNEIFTGGEVLITIIAKNQYGNIIARLDTAKLNKIIGNNPIKADLYSYINDKEIIALAESETEAHQFTYTAKTWWPYNEFDWPIYGSPNGYGVMQLDGPAATERQLWNWKENIEGGKLLRDSKRNIAKQHLDEYGDYPPEYLTQSMFQLFNGRHLYKWKEGKWEINNKVPIDREVVYFENGKKKIKKLRY